MTEPVKIFIGPENKQWLASEVLRYSILKRTQSAVEIVELKHLPSQFHIPGDLNKAILRFAIPELCHFKGRALYLDADNLVLCDVNELFNLDMGSAAALARRFQIQDAAAGYNTGVMLLNCSKLQHWKMSDWIQKLAADPSLERVTLWASPEGLVSKDFENLPPEYHQMDVWNSATKILHYSQPAIQPWKSKDHPHRQLFLDELKAALSEEEITFDTLFKEIRQGNVSPDVFTDLLDK